jgi:hypothetical protein
MLCLGTESAQSGTTKPIQLLLLLCFSEVELTTMDEPSHRQMFISMVMNDSMTTCSEYELAIACSEIPILRVPEQDSKLPRQHTDSPRVTQGRNP